MKFIGEYLQQLLRGTEKSGIEAMLLSQKKKKMRLNEEGHLFVLAMSVLF